MLRGHFYGERLVRGPRAPLGEGAALSLATLQLVASGREFEAMELAQALRNQPLLHPTNGQQKFRSRYDQGIRRLSQLGSPTAGCAALRRICPLLLIPAAFPAILAGLKIGWAFAWRTLIAAELVFGVSSRSGGLGWFIFENRNQLETAYVFAGLTAVIIIGLLVESVIFRNIEVRTVRKWGMQH